MEKGKLSTRDICMIGLWAAVIAVMAQIAIPMPMGVPMTMQTFAITMVALVLGSKKGAIASGIYVLLGAIGLPVFANLTGGLGIVLGPTGGFIISFPIMAYIIGLGIEHRTKFRGAFLTALVVGTLINYVVGVMMFCAITGSTVGAGITACVLPFIPTAIIKAGLASIIGLKLKSRLVRFA